MYYLIAVYCFVCTALMFAFTGTPLGRMLNAVRDNPERVAFVGYNPQRVRYMGFVVAGFLPEWAVVWRPSTLKSSPPWTA